MKQKIKNTLSDLVTDFLYYDRKEDEELQRGDIDKAVRDGVISIDEMVEQFRSELIQGIQ